MGSKHASFHWRRYLGERISDPQEKQRLAGEMGVNPVTLARWASTGKRPRTDAAEQEKPPRPQRESLYKFVKALPASDREKVVASIIEEFQDLTEEEFLLQVAPSEPLSIRNTCYE